MYGRQYIYFSSRYTGTSIFERPALSPPWEARVSRRKFPGDVYYYNPETEETTYERPQEAAPSEPEPEPEPETSERGLSCWPKSSQNACNPLQVGAKNEGVLTSRC